MTQFRPRLWTGVSAAVLASGLMLSGCGERGGESGEAGVSATSSASTSRAAAGSGQGDSAQAAARAAGEGGEGGSEGGGGEAGASAAYAAVPQASRDALRLAQLRGFVLAAQQVQGAHATEEAGALLGQGLTEVYEPLRVEYTRLGVDGTLLQRAAQSGSRADLDAALRTVDQARTRAGGDPAAVINGMVAIAQGLYGNVIQGDVIDPTEYQHSHGAALSAMRELETGVSGHPGLSAVRGDLQAFVGLWPTAAPPEDVARATPAQRVALQASRVQLALSGL